MELDQDEIIMSSAFSRDSAPDIFERAIIGCMLELEAVGVFKLAGQVDGELFGNPRNRFAYEVLRTAALTGSPLGAGTAAAAIEGSAGFLGKFKNSSDVTAFIEECINISRPAESWTQYTKSLKIAYSRRRLLSAFDDATIGALSADSADDAVSVAVGKVVSVASELRRISLDDSNDMDAITEEYLERYESPEGHVIPFPQHQLNTSGGYRPGNVIILSGYTGSRKSFTALDWVMRATIDHGKKCSIYTLENSADETVERMLAMHCGLDLNSLITKREPLDKVESGLEKLEDLDISIYSKGINASRIIADIVTAPEGDRPDIVVVDHIHLLPFGDDQYMTSLNGALAAFKACAQDYGITMILVAQLSRPADKGKDLPEPDMMMLKFSSAIEQIADFIVFVHKKEDRSSTYIMEECKMWVEKQRQGLAGGKFNVEFKKYVYR